MRVLFARVMDVPSAQMWMRGMSAEKRAGILRLRRAEDACAAITAHRLLCFALKSYFGLEPEPDDWGRGEYGKPYLKCAQGIHFNISHSGAMAMCALHEREVGADIEQMKPCPESLVKRIMSTQERELYASSPDKVTLFFQIWTLKEAYMKYTGKGLSALDSISVFPVSGGIKSSAGGCRFTLIADIPGYQAAVCADTKVSSVEHVGISSLESF